MHACSRMLDLSKPGECSHLSRLPCSREQEMRAWEKEAAEGEDFSLNAFTAKITEGRLMTNAAAVYATLDDWMAHEAIPCSLDSRPDFNAAVDTVIASLSDSVALLGFGEAP